MNVQLAFITPTAYLEEFASQGDIHLILAHLVGDNDYTRYYAKEDKLKILDNGLFEGEQVPTEELLEKAALVNADVVVAPDILFNCDATLEEFDKFKEAVKVSGKDYKIFAVPQGETMNDWLRCYVELVQRGANYIGLSILAVPKAFGPLTGTDDVSMNRIVCMNFLEDYNLVFPDVRYHCLGLGSYVGEIKEMANHPWIFSNDSCSAFQTAEIRKQSYYGGYVLGGKPKEKLDFELLEMKDENFLVYKNIITLKHYAQR